MADSHRWRILLLDTKRSNPNHYLCLGISQALKEHPDVESVVSANLGEAVARAGESNCNLFIAFDGEELHRGVCARLANLCGRSLLWVTEDPYEAAVNIENATIFDLVFTNDSASVHRYGDKGRHLPLASDPDLHFLEVQEDSSCLYDVFFAGTAWPNRVTFIKEMLDRIAGLKVKLILPHNEHLPEPSRTVSLPKSAYSWRTCNAQFVQFANRSRVTLSLHRVFSSSSGGSPMAMTPGPRLFEVALAGGFQLVDLSLRETREYFSEGREFVGFTSTCEAADKLEYYLSHPAERLAIAKAAQLRALEHHTYDQRVRTLLSEAARIPEELPAASLPPRKKRILHVTHNIVGVAPYGGVEIYQDLIARRLSAEGRFEIFFYVPDSTGASKVARLLDGRYGLIEEFEFSSISTQELLTDKEREQSFARLLAEYSIDVVHFQHLIGHVPSLPYIARGLGVPTILSFHDYYTVCWNINLLNHQGRFCVPESISETSCDVCIGSTFSGLPGSQSCRRGFYGRMLSKVSVLHCNTEEVARRLCAVYPQLKAHSSLVVKGVPIPDGSPARDGELQQPMRVVVLGNFTFNKGAEFLIQLFSMMRDDPVVFDILGTIEPAAEAEIERLDSRNVIIRGGYAPGEQGAWLKGASVALFASKWPETYCLSLSEAWQAGLVPVGPDIGAFSERINHGVNGFKYGSGQMGNLIDLLRLLACDQSIIRKISAGLNTELYGTESEHCQWLGRIYQDISKEGTCFSDLPKYGEMEELAMADCGVVLTHPAWLRRGPRPLEEGPVCTEGLKGLHLVPSPYQRTLSYLRRYGISATARRVMYEVRSRVGRVQ